MARPSSRDHASPVKLHTPSIGSLNTVTAYGDGFVEINKRNYAHPVLFYPEGEVAPWPVEAFDAVNAESFDAVVEAAPAVLIVGTGARQRFLHPRVLARLHAARIGVETMDTGAACRTYNVLMSEGRKVAAALLPI